MLKPRITMLVVSALVLSACATSNDGTTTTQAPQTTVASATETTPAPDTVPTDYAGFRLQAPACGATEPSPAVEMRFDQPGDAAVDGEAVVVLATSCGPIEITVDPSVAPETVNSFAFLAEEGFFDGTVSHRVIPEFMMQAGDPTATGRGGPGYTIPDELPQSGTAYQRGVVAMANAGPDTSGSQFFILFGHADWLPPSYSVFGQVSAGLETLDAIEQLPLGQAPSSADGGPSTPLETLYIESATVVR
ncbi:MAG: peptidylprolyl isomerase [Acidimicrobiia bacterium]